MAELATLSKYDSYKSSGFEWIGVIPEHWSVKKLKFIDSVMMGQSPDSDSTNNQQIGIPFLQGNAEFGSINPTPKLWCTSPKKVCQKGDILFSIRAPVGAINVADQEYCIGRGLAAISVGEEYSKIRVYQMLASVTSFKKLLTGSTFEAISTEDLKNLFITCPTKSELGLIASFLDKKTAQIDQAIAIKEKQIERLTERKQIIIQHAVTQGLHPDVPMKSSGVDWIGEIPEHWEVKKLKYLVSFVSGGTPSKENSDFWNGDICWVSPKDMKVKYIADSIDKITEVAVKKSSVKLLPENTVLIVVRGMILAKKIPIAITTKQLTINQDMKGMLATSNCNSRYLLNLLDGLHEELSTILEESGHGTKTMPTDKLGSFKLPFPPESEQNQIIKFVESESNQFDKAVNLQQQQIQKLKEYKTTLINSAVTGKIKVPGVG